MQDQIVPIDILERFENENDVSAAPSSDILYVFCPNTDISNNISSYSAYGMTVGNLIQLYNDYCEWDVFNKLSEKLNELSSQYYESIRPTMLSAFPTPAALTGVYMCRAQKTNDNFPYETDVSSTNDKRTPATIKTNYTNQLNVRTKKMMYHGWGDDQAKQTDISVLSWLAPNEKLNNPNAISYDKYLEYRRQFITSLLQNRKRVIMAQSNLYAKAIKASRMIRFGDKIHEEAYDEYLAPDLKLNNETKIDENP